MHFATLRDVDVRGKRVLLKPNLVEFDSSTVINTDASVIAAAVEQGKLEINRANARGAESAFVRAAPLIALADALRVAGIPAQRFRTLRPGEVWEF